MANEAIALSRPAAPGAPSEADYQAFNEVLAASARGRAFLAEYTRRQRSAETGLLLAALGRLEALVRDQGRTQGASAEPPRTALLAELRSELLALRDAIRAARPDIEASALPARAIKLGRLVDMLERRIEALAEARPEGAGAPEAAGASDTGIPRLALVTPPAPPERTSPAATEPAPPAPSPPAEAQPARTAASIPAVEWLVPASEPPRAETPPSPALASPAPTMTPILPPSSEPAPATVATPAQNAAAGPPALNAPQRDAPPKPSAAAKPAGTKPPVPLPPTDPLAALTMLSETERLALFT